MLRGVHAPANRGERPRPQREEEPRGEKKGVQHAGWRAIRLARPNTKLPLKSAQSHLHLVIAVCRELHAGHAVDAARRRIGSW